MPRTAISSFETGKKAVLSDLFMKVPLNAAGQDAARLCPVKVFRFLAELPHGGAGGLVPIERARAESFGHGCFFIV